MRERDCQFRDRDIPTPSFPFFDEVQIATWWCGPVERDLVPLLDYPMQGRNMQGYGGLEFSMPNWTQEKGVLPEGS